jgi:hypothetical protein
MDAVGGGADRHTQGRARFPEAFGGTPNAAVETTALHKKTHLGCVPVS